MKLGFNLLLWTTHVVDDHAPLFDRLKATGYDGVEIPLFEGDGAHYARLGRRIRDAGARLHVRGVMPSGRQRRVVGRRPAPGRARSPEMGDRLLGGARLSDALRALPPAAGRVLRDGPTEAEKRFCAEVHQAWPPNTPPVAWRCPIEPLNRFECYFLNTAADAHALVQSVGEPNYGYLYDTFHFNIEEKEPARRHRGDSLLHQPRPYLGERPRHARHRPHRLCSRVFRARRAGYDGWLTVEAFGSALPDLAAATKIWRPLFDKPEDVYEGAYRLMRGRASRQAAQTLSWELAALGISRTLDMGQPAMTGAAQA